MKFCTIEGCQNLHYGRGWCNKHYARVYNRGTLETQYLKGIGDTVELQFWSRVNLTADDQRCWIWQGAKIRKGYGSVTHEGQSWLAHRLAWFFIKGVEPSLNLLHSCPSGDNPSCVNPLHLREGTKAENSQDAVDRGTQVKGESCGRSKLKDFQILEIKQRLAMGESQKAIANIYGVAQPTIYSIKAGYTWKHI